MQGLYFSGISHWLLKGFSTGLRTSHWVTRHCFQVRLIFFPCIFHTSYFLYEGHVNICLSINPLLKFRFIYSGRQWHNALEHYHGGSKFLESSHSVHAIISSGLRRNYEAYPNISLLSLLIQKVWAKYAN